MEGLAVSFAFAENRDPGQSRLRAFEHQKLEQDPVVVDGFAPLFVVVLDVEFVRTGPAAAGVYQIVHRNFFLF